jgi:hypothetical protein
MLPTKATTRPRRAAFQPSPPESSHGARTVTQSTWPTGLVPRVFTEQECNRTAVRLQGVDSSVRDHTELRR